MLVNLYNTFPQSAPAASAQSPAHPVTAGFLLLTRGREEENFKKLKIKKKLTFLRWSALNLKFK